ncbi:SsrA-binding protein SmpB [Halodesulfovibrio marinisediminis]|uniref:SsrA-binding protein n=1 Tax=Halodesulfovibrio marinisediminis DSM 17456 TaxID=1121457 RepID=A0A1N6HE65_9BACT|nr:SsrA-binding protein SmpB [Halodesulfovibrio marinisediminis]SIO18033.1 SsrA-binding protein [Halodesulfovibrio marinisediminis DSM 17456]
MSKKKKKKSGGSSIAVNKKARRYYEVLDTQEAGIVLQGTEVKSLRAGQVAFKDSYINYKDGEAWLVGLHIAPYENAGYSKHDPDGDRKLLLHRREIEMWMSKVEQKGLTVVPLKLYFKGSRIKLEIGLCRGKKLHDQRETIKQRDAARDLARQMMGQ